MGKLVLYMPDGSMHDIPLDKERVTIGRRPDNDVCLPYPAVSGEHAAVVNILADSFLEDLGSTNGTLVNGKPVVKHFLRDNDLIDIGRQRLVYFADSATRPEPLTPDVLRREVLGLHEQVERVRVLRGEERRKPLSAPGASGPRTEDPLIPDDELLADLEAASFPGEKLVAPAAPAPATAPERVVASESSAARAPAQRGRDTDVGGEASRPRLVAVAPSRAARRPDPSAVATRLASTWTDTAPPRPAPSKPAAAPAATQARAVAVGYAIRVLTGPSAGRELPLVRNETSVGRVGTQVARIVRGDDGYLLALVEGDPVLLNGGAIPAEGATLNPGDRFVVAGVELAFEQR